MSELNEGTVVSATLTPEQTKAVADYNSLPTEKRLEVNGEIEQIQAKVADGLIKAGGWDILRQLYGLAMQRVMLTAQFTIPVLKLREQIITRVQDPEGFNKSFQTLCNDVQLATFTLRELGKRHLHLAGTPTADDLAVVQQLVGDYNTMLTSLETTVDPLMFSLHEIVLKECAELFAVQEVPVEPAQ